MINKNKSIGYCIFERIFFEDISEPINDTDTNIIKNLDINNTYIQNEINIPANTSVEFHEKDYGDFIERYGIFVKGNFKHLIMDAFYPKNFENDLKPYIIKSVNAQMSILSE